MRLEYAPYLLKFYNPARTSRDVMLEKLTCFLKIYDEHDPTKYGIGEAALFPGLSPESNSNYEVKLLELVANVALGRTTDLSRYSSIQFGFEQALYNYSNGCNSIYFPSQFTQGEASIEINGLVWMGTIDEMLQRAEEKIKAGFHCIKFKIGALEWEQEYEMLRQIRNLDCNLELRVDANGAFSPDTVMEKLSLLADINVASLEQPLPKGNLGATAFICRQSPVSIALDEELIGVHSDEERKALIAHVKPQYLVLKPALCGGFSGAESWIKYAIEEGIGYWVTSALESNIGLNALAQWTFNLDPKMAQGLGTGALYSNNFTSPLHLEADKLLFSPEATIDRDALDKLDWRG